jgi:hypothetical protein
LADLHVDHELLRRFEAGFDPRRPERSKIPARVLGQGRVGTVLAIEQEAVSALVFKRLPMFRSVEEAERYEALHRKYIRTLGERAGLRVMPSMTVQIADVTPGRVVVYIVQEQAPEDTAGHTAIYHLSPADVSCLLLAILQETAKVFDFNLEHRGTQELGFDPRMSNWALLGFDPERPCLPERIRLAYLDTSTPMMRRHGQEQLDTEPFLRGMPALMPTFIRRSALNDLISRYYDFRRAVVDLVANLHSEGRSDLVPWLTDTVNWFFLAEREDAHFHPLTLAEVDAHHRRDVLYWRTYMALRRLNRLAGR